MTELAKGGNAPLADGVPVAVELRYAGGPLDVSALLLGPDGRVRSDDDMVFFNQPTAEAGAVRLEAEQRLTIQPHALPPAVDRVAIVASCDPEDPARTFAEVKELSASATQDSRQVVFPVPPMTEGERAAVLLEIYRRGDGWKIRAVGQGYASGLAGLATDFGITVDDDPTAAEPPAPVSISLEKSGRVSISLDKQDRELVVTASLVWDGGSDERREKGADLDLYALYVPAATALRGSVAAGTVVRHGHRPEGTPLRTAPQTPPPPAPDESGKTSRWRRKAKEPRPEAYRPDETNAVYYRRLGSLDAPPYIALEGDARVPGRETIRIARPDEQGYVLLCAYSAVENGDGSFRGFGAHVEVTDGRGSTVTVPLYEDHDFRYWVAIAFVDFTEPEGAAIRQVEEYGAPDSEERPVLHLDGTIEMDAGPMEFKDLEP
ncbi:TerD family protein [Streptomyces sp. 6N223]|uniref:TerD family protein n=1 Tax=Streptomyces sp. 6N223 TaxID=3457412 RepID=UPI003FD240B0